MDEIIFDVRKIRDQIVAEYNYDLHSLCEEIRRREKQHKERLVDFAAKNQEHKEHIS